MNLLTNAPGRADLDSAAGRSRGLSAGLWVAQGLLALVFSFAGLMKLVTPIGELAKNEAWIQHWPMLIRFIGVSELAGALGLLLPALTRLRPKLTSLAALGLVMVMVLATCFHLLRGEARFTPLTVALGLLAAFVAWGRHRWAPISPR